MPKSPKPDVASNDCNILTQRMFTDLMAIA